MATSNPFDVLENVHSVAFQVLSPQALMEDCLLVGCCRWYQVPWWLAGTCRSNSLLGRSADLEKTEATGKLLAQCQDVPPRSLKIATKKVFLVRHLHSFNSWSVKGGKESVCVGGGVRP